MSSRNLSLAPALHTLEFRSMWSYPDLWVLKILTQVLMPMGQALYWLRHLPKLSRTPYFYLYGRWSRNKGLYSHTASDPDFKLLCHPKSIHTRQVKDEARKLEFFCSWTCPPHPGPVSWHWCSVVVIVSSLPLWLGTAHRTWHCPQNWSTSWVDVQSASPLNQSHKLS